MVADLGGQAWGVLQDWVAHCPDVLLVVCDLAGTKVVVRGCASQCTKQPFTTRYDWAKVREEKRRSIRDAHRILKETHSQLTELDRFAGAPYGGATAGSGLGLNPFYINKKKPDLDWKTQMMCRNKAYANHGVYVSAANMGPHFRRRL